MYSHYMITTQGEATLELNAEEAQLAAKAQLATKEAQIASLTAKIDTLNAALASDSKQRGLLQGEVAALKKQLAVLMSDEEAAQV